MTHKLDGSLLSGSLLNLMAHYQCWMVHFEMADQIEWLTHWIAHYQILDGLLPDIG